MTSVVGRKVDEPKIVSRSNLPSGVQAGLAEAWTLFARDGNVQQKAGGSAQKQAPTSGVRGRTTGPKPASSVKDQQPPHSVPEQAPVYQNGARLAWEDPAVRITTATTDPVGRREDRTQPAASSAKQPLKKPPLATSSASLLTGNDGNHPGLVQRSYPAPYSNAQAVFGPPVDFNNPPPTQHVSTRPLQAKQTADVQMPLTRKTTALQQEGASAKPQVVTTTSQEPITSVELTEDTLAALRATIERQKQNLQGKTIHDTGGDSRHLEFQDLSGGSVNTAALDSLDRKSVV